MNPQLFSFVAAALAAVVTTLPALGEDSPAKDANRPAKVEPADGTARNGAKSLYPFRGTVASVDAKARTIGLARQEGGDRVLKIGPESAFARDGKDIAIEDVKKGDYLHGRVERQANGEEVIVKATASVKPEKTDAAEKPKREKKNPAN